MDATIIIPARNAARFLDEQLDALSKQTFAGEWEIIVADNGSTDDTARRARAWMERLPRLRVIDASAARGANHARNRGIENARGRLLVFCDADDRASEAWLAELVAASEHAPFLGGPLDLLALNTARQRAWYGNDTMYPGIRPWPSFLGWVTSANFAITAELAEALGPFDTKYVGAGDDVAISWRASLLGTPPTAVPGALMHYRLRPAGLPAWKHQHLYGKRQVTLFRDFRSRGLPRRPPREIAVEWSYATLASACSPFLSAERRAGALRLLAYNTGRLVASFQERTLYL